MYRSWMTSFVRRKNNTSGENSLDNAHSHGRPRVTPISPGDSKECRCRSSPPLFALPIAPSTSSGSNT